MSNHILNTKEEKEKRKNNEDWIKEQHYHEDFNYAPISIKPPTIVDRVKEKGIWMLQHIMRLADMKPYILEGQPENYIFVSSALPNYYFTWLLHGGTDLKNFKKITICTMKSIIIPRKYDDINPNDFIDSGQEYDVLNIIKLVKVFKEVEDGK